MNGNGSALIDPASEAVDILNRGGAMQQVRTAFTTAVAVQRPRNLQHVRRRLEEEAMLAGEDFYYGWGAGDNAIEGPSVHLALAAARCFGNCAIDTLPVQETQDGWIFTASFIDLETGFTLTRQFRQSKTWTVFGRMDEQRKEDVRFQLGQSKAIRNVILNSMPRGLVEHAMEKAKAGVKEQLDEYVKKNGMAKAVDLTLGELAKLGVKEAQVLEKFAVTNRNALDLDKLVMLRGDLNAIRNGQERATDLYPASQAAARKADEKLQDAPKAADKPKAPDAPPSEPKQEAQKQEPPAGDEPQATRMTDDQSAEIADEMSRAGKDQAWINAKVTEFGLKKYRDLNTNQADQILAELRKMKTKEESPAPAKTPRRA